MASNLTIRKLGDNEYPDTQLRYVVCDEIGKVVSAHHWKVDAQKMAASALMLEALDVAKSYLLNASYSYGMATEWNESVDAVEAAIKAAKGK